VNGKEKPEWEEVAPSELNAFPHNCIGSIKTAKTGEFTPNYGTGFLISANLVLTSAYTFQIRKKDNVI
jgi:V8-like Glu-specific endopeptidase